MLTKALEVAIGSSLVGPQDRLRTGEEPINRLEGALRDNQLVRELVRRIRVGDLFTPLIIARPSHADLYRVLFKLTTKQKLEREIQQVLWAARHKTPVPVRFVQDMEQENRVTRGGLRESGISVQLGGGICSLFLDIFLSELLNCADGKSTPEAVMKILRNIILKHLAKIHNLMDIITRNDSEYQPSLL